MEKPKLENYYLSFSKYLFTTWPKYFLKKNIFVLKNDYYHHIIIKHKYLNNVLNILKNNQLCLFKICLDIVCSDNLKIESNQRFKYVIILSSVFYNNKLLIYVENSEKKLINQKKIGIYNCRSICNIFLNANWFERENWDMFGIFFYEHPNLQRILTDYGFKGYPLRKDFPLTGYYEVSYKDSLKQLNFNLVELFQDFRYFRKKNVWVLN